MFASQVINIFFIGLMNVAKEVADQVAEIEREKKDAVTNVGREVTSREIAL